MICSIFSSGKTREALILYLWADGSHICFPRSICFIICSERNAGSMYDRMREVPITVVNITSPGYNAQLGRYFIGQTGELNFGNGADAWGGVVNPIHSGVNLFFDIFTITNFSEEIFTSEIWLNAKTPKDAVVSSTVTPSNQAIIPPPEPRCILKYSEYLYEPLAQGINIFDRIVTPESTLVSDSHQGSIIIGPGDSFSILLKSPGTQIISGRIVLTWWEEKIHSSGPWS